MWLPKNEKVLYRSIVSSIFIPSTVLGSLFTILRPCQTHHPLILPSSLYMPESSPPSPSFTDRLKRATSVITHHAKKHTGTGIICAVAYFDPYALSYFVLLRSSLIAVCRSGNWGVDLQAGSQFGYRLLFVVLLAGLFAVFLQVRLIDVGYSSADEWNSLGPRY